MPKTHRVLLSLAGLMLTAGATLGAIPPAGAATSAPLDFPTSPNAKGILVNVKSGMCLTPLAGDTIVQQTCNGSTVQEWLLQPQGTLTFISDGPFFSISHPGFHIVDAQTGQCLDDQNGVSSNGANVQVTNCVSNATDMQWGSFAADSTSNYVANVHASLVANELVTLEVSGASLENDALVQLFDLTTDNLPQQEWVFKQT